MKYKIEVACKEGGKTTAYFWTKREVIKYLRTISFKYCKIVSFEKI